MLEKIKKQRIVILFPVFPILLSTIPVDTYCCLPRGTLNPWTFNTNCLQTNIPFVTPRSAWSVSIQAACWNLLQQLQSLDCQNARRTNACGFGNWAWFVMWSRPGFFFFFFSSLALRWRLFFITAGDHAFAAPRPKVFYRETSSLVTWSNWPRRGLVGPSVPFSLVLLGLLRLGLGFHLLVQQC